MDKQGKAKKPISQFEFAIMEVADPDKAKLYRPLTDKERDDLRAKSIKDQFSNLNTITMNKDNVPQGIKPLTGINDKPKCPICGEAYPSIQDLMIKPENYIAGQLLPTKSDSTKHVCKNGK